MTKRNTKAVAKPYTPTPEELEKVELVYTRLRSRPPSPELKLRINENDVLEISFDHADQKLAVALAMANLGADDVAFFYGLLGRSPSSARTSGRSTRRPATSSYRSLAE